jgi:hypothetical protein
VVYSFELFKNPTFINPADKFDIGDTIYLRLEGKDGDPTNQDNAKINIKFLNSNQREFTFILRETGMNTGIYEGEFKIPSLIEYFGLANIEPRADPTFTRVILFDYPFRPVSVSTIGIFSDQYCTKPTSYINFNEEAFIKVTGMDSNANTRDKAFVNLTSDKNGSFKPIFVLDENGPNTGEYIGSFKVEEWMQYFENFTVSSFRDPSLFERFMIHTPLQIRPFNDNITAREDIEYREHYWNFGWVEDPIWTLTRDSDWIRFDEATGDLYGTPNNTHIGSTEVELNLSEPGGYFSSHKFTIEVENSNPKLIGTDILEIEQGEFYEVDYDCDDDGQGTIRYYHSTNADWLEIEKKSGILYGWPTNDDTGEFFVNVSVTDGNGGLDFRTFNIIVLDVNDPPIIQTEPVTGIYQEENYYVHFHAIDIDDINTFEWTLSTDARFLEIDNQTGVLTGIPENDDVGIFFVNISAWDIRGENDYLNYTLEVMDINDPPIWKSKPLDSKTNEGEEFIFMIKAQDIDEEDTIEYSILSTPSSDITIDRDTGELKWTASLDGLTPNPDYVLNVEITATDGKEHITHWFSLIVIPNPSPTSTLLEPENERRVPSQGILLEWEGEDDGEEPLLYDIYLGTSEAGVSELNVKFLWNQDVTGISIQTGPLDGGETYYWTVIPKDIFSIGSCTNGVFSFTVNNPPTFDSYSIPEAITENEFRLNLKGSDQDGDDLKFTLINSPNGMEIFDGVILWNPSVNQIGTNEVNVSLSDGIETVYDEFEVVVSEKEVDTGSDSNGSILLPIIIIGVILVLIGAGIGALLYLKNKTIKEPEEKQEQKVENPTDTGPTEEENREIDNIF